MVAITKPRGYPAVIKIPNNKVIITVAQTGAYPLVSKALNPAVPEQPDEIAESAYACYQEGAALCHIHARDKEGKSTGSKEVFQEIHNGIRAKCNMIVQDSTGADPILPPSSGSNAFRPSRTWHRSIWEASCGSRDPIKALLDQICLKIWRPM